MNTLTEIWGRQRKKMIRIVVSAQPQACPRPRFTRAGSIYMPREYRQFQAQVKAAGKLAMAGRKPLLGALKCRLKFYRQFRADSRRFGDADNLAKAITDALNKIAFADDSQITQLTVEKIQSQAACVEVEISSVDEK